MKCPNCNVALVMTARSGIEIDYCPECRGVWLDRGELDKIIERSSQNSTQSYQSHQDDGHRAHGKGDYYKKKKSFLGELLDF